MPGTEQQGQDTVLFKKESFFALHDPCPHVPQPRIPGRLAKWSGGYFITELVP